jgi:altronate hydrolase
VAPLIKVTGNSRTYERMREDMDFNAGKILTGEQTLDQAAEDLMQMVGDVAAGTQSKPEALGPREFFVMYKHQETPQLAAGCHA